MRQEAQGEPTVTKIANTYDLWRSLIAEKHLPEDVAKDVKHELKAIDRAQEHYLETVARSHTIASSTRPHDNKRRPSSPPNFTRAANRPPPNSPAIS